LLTADRSAPALGEQVVKGAVAKVCHPLLAEQATRDVTGLHRDGLRVGAADALNPPHQLVFVGELVAGSKRTVRNQLLDAFSNLFVDFNASHKYKG
jgi:hypothetical protein